MSAALGRLFHLLFDRVASAAFIRWRYEKKYRQSVAASVQELQGGNLVERSIRLDQMYVPSLLTQEMRPDVRSDLADRFRTRDEMRQRQQAQAVGPWQALQTFPRYVVLGGPGVGKTTYLYHLAFMCALRRRSEVAQHIPVFIRFRELVQDLTKLQRLEDYFPRLFAGHDFPNATRFVMQQLALGRCLILLDGLDEVPSEEDHQRLITLVQAFADRYVPAAVSPVTPRSQTQNILVVSSRKYSYEHGTQLTGFPKTEVMEFDNPAIAQFVHNWFGTNGALADELIAALQGNARFLELARNPLLLLLIAHHYERERNLPGLRAELYQHCIRTRITRWNTTRGTHQGRFGENDKWRMLRDLALHIFQHEEKGLLWRTDLLDWVENFAEVGRLPEGTTAEMLLDEVARTSGLIQEWAIDRYGFSHHTLQEYFAADAINRLGPDQGAALLEPYLDRPAWKEVILLYAGQTDNADPLLRRLLARARRPDGGGALWLLAAGCLAEGARQVADVARRELTATLVSLLQDPADPLTEAGRETALAALPLFAADLLPPHVTALLAQENSAVALLAARLLPDNAPADLRAAVQGRMVALAGDADLATQQAALAALGRLGGADAGAVAALRLALSDADAAARAEAALALARLGAAAVTPDVVDALRRMHEADAADAPRQAALAALLALGQAAAVGMVHVPAGEFLMGSGDDDRAAGKDEKPQQRLYLPSYYLDRAPVTNAQFRRFLEAGGYANPAYWAEAQAAGRWQDGQYIDYNDKKWDRPRYWDDAQWNGATQPVVGVSWYEALAYARWAGKRLPTEAEWEKGARGTDGRLYPWSSEWAAARANTEEAKHKQTTPVGQYSPAGDSPYGAVDMAGNVWEWCSTRWRDEGGKEYTYPYNPNDGREELGGGDDVGRVLRGGSWYNDQKLARCAARPWFRPWTGYDSRGFRCCATSSLVPGTEF
ncbi:MAG: SUMF1/EgtB/PvdO family nonheme iron enzyme [Anaerolinea sp.]|nr:SUMF1/EgtB/PvdO family nonheme iron enzyme [Anaerolinea sp.]